MQLLILLSSISQLNTVLFYLTAFIWQLQLPSDHNFSYPTPSSDDEVSSKFGDYGLKRSLSKPFWMSWIDASYQQAVTATKCCVLM